MSRIFRHLPTLCCALLVFAAVAGCDPIFRKTIPIDPRADLAPEKGQSSVLQAVDEVARRWDLRAVRADDLGPPRSGGGVTIREYQLRYLVNERTGKHQTLILSVVRRPSGKAEIVLREEITGSESPFFRNVYQDLKQALAGGG